MAGGTLEQKKQLQKQSNALLVGAIVGWIVVIIAANGMSLFSPVLLVLLIIRLLIIVPWIMGCAAYARSKGYSAIYSILGLLTIIGLLILVLLPDKYVVTDSMPAGPTNYFRPPPSV